MSKRFTAKMIEALVPERKPYFVREGDGFGIRVFPSGKKTWQIIYTFERKRKWFSLGPYPEFKLSDAREEFMKVKQSLARGIDPSDAARQQLLQELSETTVGGLVDLYIREYAIPKKKSWKEDLRMLQKDIVPVWGKRKVKEISRGDVNVVLQSIVDRGAPIQSNSVLAVVRKMFNFAIQLGILGFSPVNNVERLGKVVKKDRFLSVAEIKTLWAKLDDPKLSMSYEVRNAMKLILVTGQRPGECISVHTKEISGHWWTIPAEKTKNGREHRVYLTDLALSLLGRSGKGYIFESPRGKKPIDSTALPFAVRRNKNLLKIVKFTPHDLRRTAATHMAESGIYIEIISKILNHTDSRVTAIYNRHSYDKEKRQAMESWTRKLLKILNSK